MTKKLSKEFFARNAEEVAKDLLGKILVRKINGKILKAKIVETEAYYGEKDPASRAYGGKKNMNSVMWEAPGTIFVYMVHANWLFNIITGKKGEPQAVLIRALEPLEGIEEMTKNRRRKNKKISKIHELCSGPGKLTQAMEINRSLNGKTIFEDYIYILDSNEKPKIGKSNRIGVSKDLKKKLRFYIKGNKFVS